MYEESRGTHSGNRIELCEEAGEFRRLHVVPREHGPRVCDAQMPHEDLAEDVTEIRRHGEIASLVSAVGCEARPLSVHLTTANTAADDHHRIAVNVIRTAVAVLAYRPPKLRHRQHDRVVHPIAEIGDERRDAAREVAQAAGELSLRCALIDVRVPPADVGKRHFDAEVGFDELSDLLQGLTERARRIIGAVLGRVQSKVRVKSSR